MAGRLVGVQALSELGDFVGLSALMLLTFSRTGSVLGPAAVFAARTVPSVLVGTAFSGWLDRPPRRAALVTLALAGAAVVGAVALVPSLPVALAAAALLGASRTAYLSVVTGVVADAVDPGIRGRYYALSSTINQSAQVLGFMVGTSITLWLGARVSLAFDVVTFLVGAVVLRGLPSIAPHPSGRRPPASEGLRTIASIPVLRLLVPAVWASSLGSALPETLAPQIAHRAELPFVMAAAPFGMMAVAILVGRSDVLGDLRRQFALGAALACAFAGGALVLLSGGGGWLLILVNMAVGAAGVWIVGARTTFVNHTPPERMAQVEATMVASITLVEGIGALGVGALVTIAGPWLGYGVVAVPLACATVPVLVSRRAPVLVTVHA